VQSRSSISNNTSHGHDALKRFWTLPMPPTFGLHWTRRACSVCIPELFATAPVRPVVGPNDLSTYSRCGACRSTSRRMCCPISAQR
jgi:hypothetical protein